MESTAVGADGKSNMFFVGSEDKERLCSRLMRKEGQRQREEKKSGKRVMGVEEKTLRGE